MVVSTCACNIGYSYSVRDYYIPSCLVQEPIFFFYNEIYDAKKDNGYINSSILLMWYVSLKYRDRRSLTLSGKLFHKEITDGTNDEYK